MNIEQAKEYAKKNIHNRLAAEGRLSGKIAIVTGSAQGFGLGIAQGLYAEGACVVIADLLFQKETAEKVATELGNRAIYCPVDVSDEKSVEEMVCTTVEKFGGLDVMVSNAGVAKAGSLEEMDLKTLDFVTKINYTGFFLCAKNEGSA